MELDLLAEAEFRTAPNMKQKVLSAAKLFNEAQKGTNLGLAQFREAMSTSDFPILLSKGFEVEAIQAQKDAVKEYEAFAIEKKVSDFRPKKLRDLFGNTEFEEVGEGEEYKADNLDELEVEYKVGKYGRRFGYTWELALSGDFTDMADFPRRLGNGATERSNRNVFETFVSETGPRADFFDTVDTKPLTPVNLQDAVKSFALKEDHRGDLVDTTGLVLVVPPTLQIEANNIINAAELELQVTDGNKVTKTRMENPFRGLVTVVVAKWLAKIDKSAKRGTTWYLLANKSSDHFAVIHAQLLGHENVDIRTKRDQGNRVGGGEIPFEEGSYLDDTIDFRGRSVDGAAKGLVDADGKALVAYASTGS
ncbi:phage major capsid protein [Brevibacterium sediminis]|uniref:phage major capsid protein n=1 Tax=Brevibacterium sediminis TaxID=1857024 RepID=UPI003671C99C